MAPPSFVLTTPTGENVNLDEEGEIGLPRIGHKTMNKKRTGRGWKRFIFCGTAGLFVVALTAGIIVGKASKEAANAMNTGFDDSPTLGLGTSHDALGFRCGTHPQKPTCDVVAVALPGLASEDQAKRYWVDAWMYPHCAWEIDAWRCAEWIQAQELPVLPKGLVIEKVGEGIWTK